MTEVHDREDTVRMLRDSLAFLAKEGRMAAVRAARHTRSGFDSGEWGAIASLGLLSIFVPEERGGSGLGVTEAAAVAEELGKGLAPQALVNAIVAAPLLPDDILENVLSGDRVALPAWQEDPVDPLKLEAQVDEDAVTGVKSYIPYARVATDFLVLTTDGFVAVPADGVGVSLTCDKLHDGGHLGRLTLDRAAGQRLKGDANLFANAIMLCNAGYLLGVSQRAFEITQAYIQTREQFGRPIGSFQALQHRAVDMMLEIELLRAGLDRAVRIFGDPSSDAPVVSRIMARAATTAMSVTRKAVQMHGGIGFTDEADIGLYLRKAMVVANSMGTPKWHRQRFAKLADLPNNRLAS